MSQYFCGLQVTFLSGRWLMKFLEQRNDHLCGAWLQSQTLWSDPAFRFQFSPATPLQRGHSSLFPALVLKQWNPHGRGDSWATQDGSLIRLCQAIWHWFIRILDSSERLTQAPLSRVPCPANTASRICWLPAFPCSLRNHPAAFDREHQRSRLAGSSEEQLYLQLFITQALCTAGLIWLQSKHTGHLLNPASLGPLQCWSSATLLFDITDPFLLISEPST